MKDINDNNSLFEEYSHYSEHTEENPAPIEAVDSAGDNSNNIENNSSKTNPEDEISPEANDLTDGESNSQASSNIGFCGKIPGHGDFVSRNIADEFMLPWNEWIQTVIGVSQEQQENLWLETFLTSPVWRFALSPDACGADGMMGVMIPSVDKVGRYFPFTLAAPIIDEPLNHLIRDNNWFDEAEDLILTALEEDIDIDQLVEQAQAIPLPGSPSISTTKQSPPAYTNETPNHAKKVWSIPIRSAATITNALPGLFTLALKELFPQCSLWWTNGSDKIPPTLLICSGMPPISGYSAMLDGDWDQWGWPRHQIFSPI